MSQNRGSNGSKDNVRLGLMAPLSGLVELYGPEISWAGKIACDEVNAAGGVLGRRLELVIADDGSLPESAVPAAKRLIEEERCTAIIGNLLSNSRIAVSNLVSDPWRIPLLNFSFYEGSISSRYFFHFAALPNQQIDKMIPHMEGRFGPKFFFAGSNYEWPRGSIAAAKSALLDCGGEIVGEEYLPIGETDLGDLLNRVAHSGADVFVPYFAGADQIHLLSEFTERGLKERMAVVMGHYDEAMVGALPPDVREGFHSSNTYFMSVDTPENAAYLDQLARQPDVSNIWPKGNGVLTNFGEGTYLCVKAFAQAANSAGSLGDDALIQALERVSIAGPQGRVDMDPETHHARVNSFLSRCRRDGTFEIEESFGAVNPIIPARYRAKKPDLPDNVIQLDTASLCGNGRQHNFPRVKSTTPLCLTDASGNIVFVNDCFQQLLRIENLADVLGHDIGELWRTPELVHGVFRSVEADGWSGVLTSAESHGERDRNFTVTVDRIQDVRGKAMGYVVRCAALEENETEPTDAGSATSDQILAAVDTAIIATDETGIILRANESASRHFGYTVEELVGMSVHLLLPPKFRDMHKKHFQEFAESDVTDVRMGRRGEIAGYRKDGSEFPAEASISRIAGEDRTVLVATLKDITDRRVAQKQLMWQATHDPLTGLPNRALIKDRLANALDRSARTESGVAVLFIDLDGFKLVNDSHGHDLGDELLQAISKRLACAIRPGDTLARFGGDEFILLCEQIEELTVVSGLADRIVQELREPIAIGEKQFYITASIGLAVGYGETHSADDLFRNADAAMYLAKDEGRDDWRLFNHKIHEQAKRHLFIANGLKTAISNNEFYPRFQPIMDVASRSIVGAEILARWSPPGGEIYPDQFIPVAEMNGTILDIGRWVFEEACVAEASMRERFGAERAPYISINVSTRQLRNRRVVEDFNAILNDTGADSERLRLEITETALMDDVDANIRVLRELNELGLTVGVDDFGTGYSSLSQLIRMPVDNLKIDKSLIDGIAGVDGSLTIVEAILGITNAMHLDVVAEGVETEEQWEVLCRLECAKAQGYLFHRPVDFDTLQHIVANNRQTGAAYVPAG